MVVKKAKWVTGKWTWSGLKSCFIRMQKRRKRKSVLCSLFITKVKPGAKNPVCFTRYSGNNTVFWIQYHLCLAHLSQVTHTMTMILPLLVEMIYPNHTYLWKHNACHRGDLSLFSLDKADLNLDFQESTGTFKLNSKRWPLKSLSRHSLESSVGIITSFLLFAFQFLMCWLGKKNHFIIQGMIIHFHQERK